MVNFIGTVLAQMWWYRWLTGGTWHLVTEVDDFHTDPLWVREVGDREEILLTVQYGAFGQTK